ncbi:hypothetical protein EA76_02811 [Enterococcus faecalis]|nr:hypothetical protein EA76_02811 [Enterococcus faecalis]
MTESVSNKRPCILTDVKGNISIDICEFVKKHGYTIKVVELKNTTGINLHTDNRVKLIEGPVE